MKYLPVISLLLLIKMISVNFVFAQEKVSGFNKSVFYNVMSGNNEDDINNQIILLKRSDITEKSAYEGALLMKKAGMINGPKKKIDLFKAGHKKLEAVLNKDSTNAEFRFLRLMIQEHAPGLMGYKGEREKDSHYILKNFRKLLPVVQQAIRDYSEKSMFLKPSDF